MGAHRRDFTSNRSDRSIRRQSQKRSVPKGVTRDEKRTSEIHSQLKIQFADRLRMLMDQKGLGNAELSKLVRTSSPGHAMSAAIISHYRCARMIPRNGNALALSKALGVDMSELLLSPSTQSKSSRHSSPATIGPDHQDRPLPDLFVEARGDKIWIQINQELPWPVALEMLTALKGAR